MTSEADDFEGEGRVGENTPKADPIPWPESNPPKPGEGIACACTVCQQPWLVHPDMQGFRLRCVCGEWVQVLSDDWQPPAVKEPLLPVQRGAHKQLARQYRDPAEPLTREVSTNEPMPAGSLQHATYPTRRRWNNRAVLELVLILAAFIVPQLVVYWTAEGELRSLYRPLAALGSAVAVVVICFAAPHYSLSGLKAAAGRFYLEAIGVACAASGIAMLWINFLVNHYDYPKPGSNSIVEELGFGTALVLMAVFPAIFEELAFRGIVQGRLMAIMGRSQGIAAAAAAFAVAHGMTPGLPFHVFLGIYLGYLRDRSDSLLPGMLLHFLYNGALVFYMAS